MTLEEAIALANETLVTLGKYGITFPSEQRMHDFARFLIDTLASAQPCGYEAPATGRDGDGNPTVIVPDWHGSVDPADARAMAAMLLRAADEAERSTLQKDEDA